MDETDSPSEILRSEETTKYGELMSSEGKSEAEKSDKDVESRGMLAPALEHHGQDGRNLEISTPMVRVSQFEPDIQPSSELLAADPRAIKVTGEDESPAVPHTPTAEISAPDEGSQLDSHTGQATVTGMEKATAPALHASNSDSVDGQRSTGPALSTQGSVHTSTVPEEVLTSVPEQTESEVIDEKATRAQRVGLSPTSTKPAEHDGWTELHAAVEAGNQDLVQKLMEEGARVDDAASDGRKPLLIAAEKGFIKIVELLAATPYVESVNEIDRSTALIRACEEGHDAVVKFLVERGANMEAKGRNGWTPLFFTVASKNHNLVKYLLQHGADKTITTEDGATVEDLSKDDNKLLRILRQNYLLEGPEIGVKKSHPELRFRFVRAPEKPKNVHKLAACEVINATVIQFFIGHHEQRSQPISVSVHDLIYGKGPNLLFQSPPISPLVGLPASPRSERMDRGQPSFTWYHIPANNVRIPCLSFNISELTN